MTLQTASLTSLLAFALTSLGEAAFWLSVGVAGLMVGRVVWGLLRINK